MHKDDWDPCVLDHFLEDNKQWYKSISDLAESPFSNLFDEYGDYRKRIIFQDI